MDILHSVTVTRSSPDPINGAVPTIGVLMCNLNRLVFERQWLGALDEAGKLGINIVAFLGEPLRYPHNFAYQANRIYDSVKPGTVDGAILMTGGLDWFISRKDMEAFASSLAPLPLISLETPLSGIPTIQMDNYSGMRALVDHLIEVHGRRHIVSIRGPLEHSAIQERFRAYADSLETHGIPFDPLLVTPSDARFEAPGSSILRFLVDERGLRPGVDFDAVVACNDIRAFQVRSQLVARGIRVPEDVALVGFDDEAEAGVISPPLTTVSQPFYEAGRMAVTLIMSRLSGKPVPDLMKMPTKPVFRESCGCLSQSVVRASGNPPIVTAIPWSPPERPRDDLEKSLAEAFKADMARSGKRTIPGPFLSMIQETLRKNVDDNGAQMLQDHLSVLCNSTRTNLDLGKLRHAENIWGQARVFIGEMLQRKEGERYLHREFLMRRLHALGQTLITTFDIVQLMDVIVSELPILGFSGIWLSLYEDPRTPGKTSRLMLACAGGKRLKLPPEGVPFDTSTLVPLDFRGSDTMPRHWVVKPLYFREEQLGFVVLDAAVRDGIVYELLGGHLGSAIKGAYLVEQQRQNMERLADHNHELEVTIKQLHATKDYLVKSEKMAVLGGMVSGMANEISSPLGTSVTMASFLEEKLKDFRNEYESGKMTKSNLDEYLKTVMECMGVISADLNKAADIVAGFRQVSVDQTMDEIRAFDMASYLEEAMLGLSPRFKEKSVEIEIACPKNLTANTYPGALFQILTNLAVNSFVHGFEGRDEGTISIDVTSAEPGRVKLVYGDDGNGMPSDAMSHLFEPFFTTKRNKGGIGLGNTIVYNLVTQRLKGTICAESPPDGGLRYIIEFPLAPES